MGAYSSEGSVIPNRNTQMHEGYEWVWHLLCNRWTVLLCDHLVGCIAEKGLGLPYYGAGIESDFTPATSRVMAANCSRRSDSGRPLCRAATSSVANIKQAMIDDKHEALLAQAVDKEPRSSACKNCSTALLLR